jgi:hypothetical protein
MADETLATDAYPPEAVGLALTKISSQGLWLLLSLDHYGWRAEYDVTMRLLAEVDGEHGHFAEHGPLVALGQVFGQVDKLWRLVFAIRAHRSGHEFMNEEHGYLAGGYKLHKKIAQLAAIEVAEWSEILQVPPEQQIRAEMTTEGASPEEIKLRVDMAEELPGLLATNMREIQEYFDSESTVAGPMAKTATLREIDDLYRHGAPAVYHDCSPTESGWVNVRPLEGDSIAETIGLVMTEPDSDGASFIPLFKHDQEMRDGLLAASSVLAGVIRRLARTYLGRIEPGLLSDPLAAIGDYEPQPAR